MDSVDKKDKAKRRILLLQQIAELGKQKEPMYYGWTDLNAIVKNKGESAESLKKRRCAAIKECVEDHLYIKKAGVKINIVLTRQMTEFITDFFYGYTNKGILWKPRGGGGSLCAAILILICMLYKTMSFVDLAGSGEQAQVVYNYTKEFWDGSPEMKRNLLVDALMTRTLLKTGAELKCVPTSDKQARGQHRPGLIADESCQESENFAKIIEAAMSGVMSEAHGDYIILLLSTFHIPFGFFQEYWDMGMDRGFKRYKWTIFDCMKKCELPIDCKKCELNEPEVIVSKDGRTKETRRPECDGRARNADGWMTFEQVREAKILHKGGEQWRVEFCCNRPRFGGPIYDPEMVDLAYEEEFTLEDKEQLYVGIDFGMRSQSVAVSAAEIHGGVGIPEVRYFERGENVQEIIKYLTFLQYKYAQKILVLPDGSADFAIAEIDNAGFQVAPVSFTKWKERGIQNVHNFFRYEKLKILPTEQGMKLKMQLKKYHRDSKGKVVKKDDHGCDALLCALMAFDFLKMYGKELKEEAGIEINPDGTDSGVM